MRYAQIENGKVVNVLELAEGKTEWQGLLVVPSETAGIGDSYVGDEFVRPDPEPDPETPEQTRARLEAELDYHLDEVARSYGYRSVDAILSYLNSTNPTWNMQANAFNEFRDDFWLGAIQIQNDVEAGLRPVPTSAEMVAELPKFEDYLGAVNG